MLNFLHARFSLFRLPSLTTSIDIKVDMDRKAMLILTLITISLINYTSSKSLYTNCGNPFNFCMGKKTPSNANVTEPDHIVSYDDRSGCIKNKDCTMIIHVTKLETSSVDVTIEIASVPSHYILAGFKKTGTLERDFKGLPIDDYLMEVFDTQNANQGVTSTYNRQWNVVQARTDGKGYGGATIQAGFVDDDSGQSFSLYTYRTTTKPNGVGIDLESDQLAMFYVRLYNNRRYYDFGMSAPRTILARGTIIKPTQPPTTATVRVTSESSMAEETSKTESKEKKSFPWWMILAIFLVLLLLIALLIWAFCCRKKSPPKEDQKSATTNTSTTTSTTNSSIGGVGGSERSTLGPVASTRPSSALNERSQLPTSEIASSPRSRFVPAK